MLTIAPREAEPVVAVTRFGRIDPDRADQLPARAVGFPRFTFKLKTDDGGNVDADRRWYRDSHQAFGNPGCQDGSLPGFHLMPQPMLGTWGSGTGAPARTRSSAARNAAPVTGTSLRGRDSSNSPR